MAALVQLRGADCQSEAKETLMGTSMTAFCRLTSVNAPWECRDSASHRQNVNPQYLRSHRANHVSDMSPRALTSVKTDMRVSSVKHKKTRFSQFIGPGNGRVVRCTLADSDWDCAQVR